MTSRQEMSFFKRVGAYDLGSCLGQGSFATVYRGQHRGTKKIVAVKAIVRSRLNQKLQENLEAEISILQMLQHPNIVRLHDVQTTERHVYLVMEFCAGGDLSRLIRTCGAQNEAQARGFLLQLAEGLRYLRSHNLIHRDLKPQNLLLSSLSPEAVLKIADFGFARYMLQQDLAETLCGSPLYMAPEILRFQKYDAKADLWSVGAIMFELLTSRPPFTGANHVQLLKNIEKSAAQLPPHLSSGCRSLLGSLLRREPTERLSFEAFFADPFLDLSGAQRAGQASASTSLAPELPLQQQLTQQPPAPAGHASDTVEESRAAASERLAALAVNEGTQPTAAASPCSEGVSTSLAPATSTQVTGVPLPSPMLMTPPQPCSLGPAQATASPPSKQPVGGVALPEIQLPPAICGPPASSAAAQQSASQMSPSQEAGQDSPHLRASGPQSPQTRLPSPRDGPFAGLGHDPTPPVRKTPSPTAALLASSPQSQPMFFSPPSLCAMPEAILPAVRLPPPALKPRPSVATTLLCPASAPAHAASSALSSSSSARRQILPVHLPSPAALAHAAFPHACPDERMLAALPGALDLGVIGAPQALPLLYDKSLDGIDHEYVLVSTPTNALQDLTAAVDHVAEAEGVAAGTGEEMPHDASLREACAAQQNLVDRALAVAELAEDSLEGGTTASGEGFTPVEALALHVKALDLVQQCIALLPHIESQLGSAQYVRSSPDMCSADALRARFSSLLQCAEQIRSQLQTSSQWSHASAQHERESSSLARGSQCVCVEELLYRHALSMGREAAVDELLGKFQSSCTLYQRAKLLLEQLAQEPEVGQADRAVLSKYAAGFAWRLHEIAARSEHA